MCLPPDSEFASAQFVRYNQFVLGQLIRVRCDALIGATCV